MEKNSNITIYGTVSCSYCTAARMLFKKKGVDYVDILICQDDQERRKMEQLSGGRTVPQILINGDPIGGFDDLYALDQSGQLDSLLSMQAGTEMNSI